MPQYTKLVYDPVKKARGEKWEKGAAKQELRHFRDLLIALQTSLDALAGCNSNILSWLH